MKGAALLSGSLAHYLDHLIPLCDLLQIPLIVDDESTYELAQKLYPPLDITLLSPYELPYTYLDHFDLLFVTEKYKKRLLSPFLKHARVCYVPHGNSDKGDLNPELNPYPEQDMALIYGAQMASHVTIPHVRVGNFRRRYFLKYHTFFQRPSHAHPTLLYAPTWNDNERGTTFFSHGKELLESLPDELHLIVKLHPLLYENEIGRCLSLLGKEKKNVQVITESSPIYPLLESCDYYLGDTSSIGYDFLSFNRPLFFFKMQNPPQLHSCGLCVDTPAEIFDFIQNKGADIWANKRKNLYANAFDEDRPREELIGAIEALL